MARTQDCGMEMPSSECPWKRLYEELRDLVLEIEKENCYAGDGTVCTCGRVSELWSKLLKRAQEGK